MPGDNSYFGTRAEVDEIKNRRNAEIRAWGKEVLAEADRVKFGGEFKEDWDVLVVQEVEEDDSSDDGLRSAPADQEQPGSAGGPAESGNPEAGEGEEGVKEVVEPTPVPKKSTSKGSTAAK
jgi:hypothetical protein